MGRPRRKVVLLLVALATVIAVGRFVGEPPDVLEDEEAAGFADHGLLTAISVTATAPDSTDAVVAALQQGVIAGRANESPYGWSLLSATDDAVSVAAYYHWGKGGPLDLTARPDWGRACRVYDLGAKPVIAHRSSAPRTPATIPSSDRAGPVRNDMASRGPVSRGPALGASSSPAG